MAWHVDNMKISHADPKVVDEFIKWLGTKYSKMQTSGGKVHEYLGMTLTFSSPKKMKVSMKEYIDKSVEEFPDEFISPCASPAAEYLFRVDEIRIQL
eukprot:2171510-Ditylum_brightwellii.AAC.1